MLTTIHHPQYSIGNPKRHTTTPLTPSPLTPLVGNIHLPIYDHLGPITIVNLAPPSSKQNLTLRLPPKPKRTRTRKLTHSTTSVVPLIPTINTESTTHTPTISTTSCHSHLSPLSPATLDTQTPSHGEVMGKSLCIRRDSPRNVTLWPRLQLYKNCQSKDASYGGCLPWRQSRLCFFFVLFFGLSAE